MKNKKKQKILKTITEKEYITYRGTMAKLTTDFLSESRRTCRHVERKKLQLKILYTIKFFFKMKAN